MFHRQKSVHPSLRWLLFSLLILTTLTLVGCGDDDPVTTDTTPPTIVSIIPASGATGVSLDQVITVIFSEKMAAASITATSFTVVPTVGTVALGADGMTATFTPAVLLPSTPYTVTLTTAITDEAGNALAQNSVTTFTTGTSGGGGTPGVYSSGTYSFDYLKTILPIPPESGTFSITGASLDPSGGFPTGVNEVCGGAYISGVDTSVAFCYGARKNVDETYDIGIVVVLNPDGPVTAGSYMVSPTPLAAFAYIEGVSDFQIPPDFDPSAFEDWISTLTYERAFVSVSGTINVTTINDTSFQGTFGGNMLFETTVFAVSNGTFSMSQL